MTRLSGGRLKREETGVTTIQVAILIPAILFWIMLTVQYGLWWHAKQVANEAAAQAVDAAQLPDGTASDGQATAERLLRQSGNLTHVTIEVDRSPTIVNAEVQGRAPRLVPGFDWGVTARSEGPVERFTVEAER